MKKIVILICMVLLGAGSSSAQISAEDALELFVKGNFAYKDAKYKEASAIYEEILAGGQESGPLYYNLGNSYFKQEELGKAVLNYERAIRLSPRDSDLKANYKYAVSLAQGRISVNEKSILEKAVTGHIRFYTLDEMVVILYILGLIMGGVILFSIYFGWSRRKVQLWLTVLGIIFSIYLFGLFAKLHTEKDLYMAIAATEAKFEPREEATTHFEVPPGTPVKLIKKEEAWVKIKRMDGKVGWIPQEKIEEL